MTSITARPNYLPCHLINGVSDITLSSALMDCSIIVKNKRIVFFGVSTKFLDEITAQVSTALEDAITNVTDAVELLSAEAIDGPACTSPRQDPS